MKLSSLSCSASYSRLIIIELSFRYIARGLGNRSSLKDSLPAKKSKKRAREEETTREIEKVCTKNQEIINKHLNSMSQSRNN